MTQDSGKIGDNSSEEPTATISLEARMNCVDEDRSYRWSGRQCRAWIERVNGLYEEVRQMPAPAVEEARKVLFDADGRSGARERMLLALVDHPDPRATQLLEHRALSFDVARLSFVHALALRRNRRRIGRSRRRAA